MSDAGRPTTGRENNYETAGTAGLIIKNVRTKNCATLCAGAQRLIVRPAKFVLTNFGIFSSVIEKCFIFETISVAYLEGKRETKRTNVTTTVPVRTTRYSSQN